MVPHKIRWQIPLPGRIAHAHHTRQSLSKAPVRTSRSLSRAPARIEVTMQLKWFSAKKFYILRCSKKSVELWWSADAFDGLMF